MEEQQLTDDKEKRRKKQYKRMGKILGKAWELDDATNYFQDRPPEFLSVKDESSVLCLTEIGQKIDSKAYRFGRHGWEDFAKDLGGVYNLHIISIGNSNKAPTAKKHFSVVIELLGSVESSIAKIAKEHVPAPPTPVIKKNKRPQKSETVDQKSGAESKKRKKIDNNGANGSKTTASSSNNPNKKIKHSNKNSELAEREDRYMDQLYAFVEEHGANRNLVSGYRARVTKTRKSANRKFDVIFYNEAGRRFRSMLEIGRFHRIVKDNEPAGRSGNIKGRKGFRRAVSKEEDNEKKRIRKELDRLRKNHNKAIKALDDLVTNQSESPDLIFETSREAKVNCRHVKQNDAIENQISQNDENRSQNGAISKTKNFLCAGACIADINGFADIPEHCIPDVLMTWDFLCTFERALSLSPIALDEFANALVYQPPNGQTGDDVVVPPVYISEAHLSLLKLLLQDKSSDDWWWSTLESNEIDQQQEVEFDDAEDDKPAIKIDIASTLADEEDPLVTTSWLQSLENIRIGDGQDKAALKKSVNVALKVVSNKWVSAYLKKALTLLKSRGMSTSKKAVSWLVDVYRKARPDIFEGITNKETISKARTNVIERISKEMTALPESVPAIQDVDLLSDGESDDSDDESDDDEEENDETNEAEKNLDESKARASSIPAKPLPSLVDLLLPPVKPKYNSELVDAFSWPHVVGAMAARYLHRKKRVLNEMDDFMREAQLLSPIAVSERRERENIVASRVLTECGDSSDSSSSLEKAIEHLCSGHSYLDLSPLERLNILRLLIEAAYDTGRVYDVVNGNYKQRTNALKSLDAEQRRAKKEAKDMIAADESAAREQLAIEARERFLDEKREEIRVLNEKSKEFSDELLESFTEEDIIDFDEDIKADYEALPGPESFNKAEVSAMIKKMKEQAAFDTDALRVITFSELEQREKNELEELEGQLAGFGSIDDLDNPGIDQETRRSIDRLRRDIERAHSQAEKLPVLREKAVEQLSDAIENGTVKVLRAAFASGKKAKLCGVDDETGGIWSVDLMRDAALELENAKQNKRLLDAQKDLIAKLNKCFIRTEPIGRDRLGNNFWRFDNDTVGHKWVEAEFVPHSALSENGSVPPEFVDLVRKVEDIPVGARDMENDFIFETEREDFLEFSRREYHSSGLFPSLAKRRWGGYSTEESLRAVMKQLDSKGTREKELKERLKESLERTFGPGEKNEINESFAAEESGHGQEPEDNDVKDVVKTSGDETFFSEPPDSDDLEKETIHQICSSCTSGMGASVRVRMAAEGSKLSQLARYENGTITAWKVQHQDTQLEPPDDVNGVIRVSDRPFWRAHSEKGHVIWLDHTELFQSIDRYNKWSKKQGGYSENDATFLAYRNNLGRFCGKAADAAYASSPFYFAKLMMKREAEIYPKLKARSYDNNWGGQSGARAMWINSMKDYAYEFGTVLQGLLTLENAFFELTGKFDTYQNLPDDSGIDGTEVVTNPSRRVDMDLESIEKTIVGLWNSPTSRAVYLEIVKECKTTGMLALALDLLVRNTMKYLQNSKTVASTRGSRSNANKAETTSSSTNNYNNYVDRPVRSTRRMNAWQQQQQQDYDDSENDGENSDEDWR